MRQCLDCASYVNFLGIKQAHAPLLLPQQKTQHIGSKGNPSAASVEPRSVFDRLGPVTKPSMGSPKGQVTKPSHSCDPMSFKAIVGSEEWEIVKSKKSS